MKGKLWLWIGLGVVVLVLLIGIGAARGGKGKAQAVQFARVRQEDITSRVRAPGKIEPRTQVKISADIMGKIVRLAVKEGDQVHRGQIMLQLDDTQYRASANQARMTRSSSRSRASPRSALRRRRPSSSRWRIWTLSTARTSSLAVASGEAGVVAASPTKAGSIDPTAHRSITGLARSLAKDSRPGVAPLNW